VNLSKLIFDQYLQLFKYLAANTNTIIVLGRTDNVLTGEAIGTLIYF
jgi:hypothetical protein